MGESLFRKIIDDICATIEDLFITFLSFALVVFMIGQFYGVAYSGQEEFWYPVWAFIIILVVKIVKDLVSKASD